MSDILKTAERARWQALARPPQRLGYQLCDATIPDPALGDLACMRREGHAGEHVAIHGDAIAHDLAEALAKVADLERELSASRHDANLALAAARAHVDAVERERDDAIRQQQTAWARQAEKDRAYEQALSERDEARAHDRARRAKETT